MIINSANKNSDINFRASIRYSKPAIMNALLQDKKLNHDDYNVISSLLERVDSFKKMKESSVVEIFPRVDKGQVNLICTVFDKNKKVYMPVSQRLVRKIVKDDKFREKYLNSIESLIKNIDIMRKGIDKIARAVVNSKNIKGIIINSKKADSTLENATSCFENGAVQIDFISALNKNYNPTQRIVKMIKYLDKNAGASELSIGLEKRRTEKMRANSYFVSVVSNENGIKENRVSLSELFKLPAEQTLSQKK